jgi:hypothetical protein
MEHLAFSKLKEHKRAYLICSVGQKYIDMVETLVNQLNKYSEYPVFLYYSEGEVKFNSPNLIKQRFYMEQIMDYNIHGMDPAIVKDKILTIAKPFAFDLFVKNYNVEEFVFLDSDILVTPSIDTVFTKYSNLVQNSPIFIRYSWHIITVNGRPHVSDKILERVGAKRNLSLPALCSGFFIANSNCKSFFSDWVRCCLDTELIKYCAENKEAWGEFNDESVANALVWLYEGMMTIATDLQWAWNNGSVKFAFDFYDGKKGELPRHESLPTHYRIPPEYEIPSGLSVLPGNKIDLLGTHGIKDPQEIKNAANEIDRRFNNTKIKACVLINGNVRTADQCEHNIIETFKSIDPDYFVSTYDLKYGYHPAIKEYLNFYEDGFITREQIESLYKNINPKSILLENNDDIQEFYKGEVDKLHTSMRHESSFLQYLKIKKGLDMIKQYEEIHNFKYDLIIKTRSDLILDPIEYDLNSIEDDVVIISSKNVYPNDVVFITKRDNFINIIDWMVNEFYELKNQNSLRDMPHGLLESAILENNLRIIALPICNHVVRANQKHYYY